MKASNGYYVSGRFTQYKKELFTTAQGLADDRVRCVAFGTDGTLYAGTANGLCKYAGDGFAPVFPDALQGDVACLFPLPDGALLIGCGSAVYSLQDGTLRRLRTFDEPVVQFGKRRNSLWILTQAHLIGTSYDCAEDLIFRDLEGGKGIDLAVSEEEIYVVTETNISLVHGKRMEWKNILPRFAAMPQGTIHTATFDDEGYLWLGSDEGAAIHDNAHLWLDPKTIRSLPKNPVYKITTDKAGGRYFASDVGVIVQKKGALKYFSAERWVPDNKINDVAASDSGDVFFAATDKGIAMLRAFETTLAEKAQYFDDMIEKYHIRRDFTATRSIQNHDLNTGKIEISDNDGLWTACYVAAESFRYAATGDKEALEKARRGVHAMLFLTKVTGIPGFTARAVRYPGDRHFGNGHKEWALSPDGECEWKGETSSDEMSGHFLGMSVYYDLCADEKEKEEIREALCGIMEHILRNNYRLVDRDGLPTTWAAWDPELLNHQDKWFFERGINSLELLAFFTVCHHISGDQKYADLYDTFVRKYHYPLNAMQHKIRDAHVCHIDDNLGFLVSLTLLRLEENPALRARYLCGLEDHWQYERVEKQPMFCFIHAAFTGRDEDLVEGVQSLREIPFDLTFYRMENSKRRDLIYDTEQEEWHEAPQLKHPLPYDERNVHRPDGNCFHADEPHRDSAQEGTVYLLPYWIARYYGLLREADDEA